MSAVTCLFARLSHACLSISIYMVEMRQVYLVEAAGNKIGQVWGMMAG